MGSVKYGGAAVQASIAQRDARTPEGDSEGQGAVGSVAVAAERESSTLLGASATQSEAGSAPSVPPTSVLLGAQLKAGYRWRNIGIEGGAGLLQGWQGASSTSPQLVPYPSVELSVGPRGKAYGVFGGGSPFGPSALRPGIYTGGGFVLDNGMAFDLRAGVYRQGPGTLDTAGFRLDLAGRGPIPGTDVVSLRLAANVGFPEEPAPVDFEGSAGLIFGY